MWSSEWRHFQWPWTTPNLDFKVTSLFDAEYLKNGMRYRHSYGGILIRTYTAPIQGCPFEWNGVTLSDLVKYSMTRSIARSLCDSWAYCSSFIRHHVQELQTFESSPVFRAPCTCIIRLHNAMLLVAGMRNEIRFVDAWRRPTGYRLLQ